MKNNKIARTILVRAMPQTQRGLRLGPYQMVWAFNSSI